jgi:hypothetical protein
MRCAVSGPTEGRAPLRHSHLHMRVNHPVAASSQAGCRRGSRFRTALYRLACIRPLVRSSRAPQTMSAPACILKRARLGAWLKPQHLPSWLLASLGIAVPHSVHSALLGSGGCISARATIPLAVTLCIVHECSNSRGPTIRNSAYRKRWKHSQLPVELMMNYDFQLRNHLVAEGHPADTDRGRVCARIARGSRRRHSG